MVVEGVIFTIICKDDMRGGQRGLRMRDDEHENTSFSFSFGYAWHSLSFFGLRDGQISRSLLGLRWGSSGMVGVVCCRDCYAFVLMFWFANILSLLEDVSLLMLVSMHGNQIAK